MRLKDIPWDVPLFLEAWEIWQSEKQTAPDQHFLIWLILGGRGAGKTRAGAEWIRERVKSGARHIALVAANFREARAVMLDGQSGLLNIGFLRRSAGWSAGLSI